MVNQLQRRRQLLRELMARYDLSVDDIAQITGRSYHTVYKWTSRSDYDIPIDALDEIERRAPKFRK